MYSFCHSILSGVILFVSFLIDMSFFTTSTNAVFGFHPRFFSSLNLNQLIALLEVNVYQKCYDMLLIFWTSKHVY